MSALRRSLDLPYRPADLFELASDVGRYPDFIKWIRRLQILSEETHEDVWRGRAEATVGFLAFTETFVTDIMADRSKQSIDVTLVRGPFRRLRNAWRFAPTTDGTRVEFSIDFAFRNLVLQAVADANRDAAVSRIMSAFIEEAGRRYQKVEAGVSS